MSYLLPDMPNVETTAGASQSGENIQSEHSSRKRDRSSPRDENTPKKSKAAAVRISQARGKWERKIGKLDQLLSNIQDTVERCDKLAKSKKNDLCKEIKEVIEISNLMKNEITAKLLEADFKEEVEGTVKDVVREELMEVEESIKEVVREEIRNVRDEIKLVRDISQNRMDVDGDGFQVASYARAVRDNTRKVKVPGVKPMPVPKKRKTFIIRPKEGNEKYKTVEDIKEGLKTNIRPGTLGMKVHRLVKGRDSMIVEMEEELSADFDGFTQKVREIGLDCTEPGKKNPRVVVFDVKEGMALEDIKSAVCEQNRDVVRAGSEEDIKPLYVFGKRNTGKVNCVFEVTAEMRKNLIEKQRIFIEWESCKVMDHVRAVFCFKCQKFGHIASKCEGEARCGLCSQGHETRDCQESKKDNFVKKCVMCTDMGISETGHKAGSRECGAYKRRLESFVKTINYG